MNLPDEFRMRAERCLKLARDAPTLEAQTHWLAMAQLWLSLSQHAEEQDVAPAGATATPPTGGQKNGNKKNGKNTGDKGGGR